MACVHYLLIVHLASATDEHLEWMWRIVTGYTGPNPVSGVQKAIEELRTVPQQVRDQAFATMRDPTKAKGMVQYSLPFLSAQLANISIYPVPFQSAVLRIKDQVDMFNQRVAALDVLRAKTFDASLSAENHAAVISGIAKGERDLAVQSRLIADAIDAVPY
jgi:hypothetical protein